MRASEATLDRERNDTRAAWIKASADYYLALHPEEANSRRAGVEAGIPSVSEIRDRAGIADRANKAIPRGGRLDPDPQRHDEWSAQVGWAEETLRAVFTDGFRAAVAAIKAGDPSGLEYCVRFLEADPWCFRSGYTKERIIPAIAQLQLDESTRQRLARVVLAVVDDPRPRREIRRYGKLARHVATSDLGAQLEQRTESADPQVRLNARWVLDTLG